MCIDSNITPKATMTIKQKNYIAIIIVFIIISGLFFIGAAGFKILSGMRAYVGAEGLWAKAQNGATSHLIQYVFTGKETIYKSFIDDLKVPLGYKTARLELNKLESSEEVVFQGFRDGKSHLSDIPELIFLYKYFKNTHHVSQAIEQWEIADALIDKLLVVGQQVNRKITQNIMSEEEKERTLITINLLQNKLKKAENMFSHYMSLAARSTANRLFVVMLIFTLIGSVSCILVLGMIMRIISDLNDKKIQYMKQVEQEKLLKNEIQKSEIYLDNIINNIGDPVFVKNKESKFILVNNAFCILLELKQNDIIGKTLAEDFPPTEMENFLKVDNLVLETGKESLNEETLTVRDKQTKTIITRKTRFVDHNGDRFLIGVIRDTTERKQTEEQRDKLIDELQKTLTEVKTLRGCLPICSNCKNIRDDKGYWNQIETYIQKHSDTEFTHGICPGCAKILYPDMDIYDD